MVVNFTIPEFVLGFLAFPVIAFVGYLTYWYMILRKLG